MKDNIYEYISTSLKIAFFIISVIVFCKIFYDYGKSQKEIVVKSELKCIKGSLWQLSEDKTYFYPAPSPTKCLTNGEVK